LPPPRREGHGAGCTRCERLPGLHSRHEQQVGRGTRELDGPVNAAPAIARAVSASAGSAGQSEAELDAFIKFVSESDADADSTSVFGQFVVDVGALLATGVEPVSGDAFADGLAAARRAGDIVAVELEPAEGEAIRGWYLEGPAASLPPRAKVACSGSAARMSAHGSATRSARSRTPWVATPARRVSPAGPTARANRLVPFSLW
jgi:hypothetical protein